MAVSLRWLGCSTFQLRIGTTVVMLDAYVDRSANAAGPGLAASDIADADWILVGHSHFDHLFGADTIATNTGATIVGSYETVRVMRELGVPREQLIAVSGGETVALADGVTASVYPSLHSSSWVQVIDPAVDEDVRGNLGVSLQERQARARSLGDILAPLAPPERQHLESTFSLRARGDGGPLLYSIATPDGTLLFQDTAGCWTGILDTLHPDAAILAVAGRGTENGEPWQGMLADFVAMEARALGARVVIPCHHDDWLPGFATPSALGPVRAAFAAGGVGAELVELDYEREWPLFAG